MFLSSSRRGGRRSQPLAWRHWQIVKHGPAGSIVEGASKTLAVADATQQVVDTALAAANLIGDGLYTAIIQDFIRRIESR